MLKKGGLTAAMKVVLGGAIALGVMLRFLWVGKRELWYDEVLSVLLSTGNKNAYQLPENVPFRASDISTLLFAPFPNPAADTVETLKNIVKGTLGDPHPPLFYLSQYGWIRLFGSSEGALRSLVLLISLAALCVAYFVGKRILGARGGLIFTALLALNPFFLAHSLNLRMYAPMVFWVLVSAGCLLSLVDREAATAEGEAETAPSTKIRAFKTWVLRFGLAISLAAGLLTQYLFAYWLFSLAALALYLDRKRWIEYALTLSAGLALFAPWALWGVRQQMHNRRDVLSQISSVGGPLQSALAHGKGLAQTLANHLLLGHLTTGMLPMQEPIKPTAVVVGCSVIGFLIVCVTDLYRRRQYQVLIVSVLMGLLPLAVALVIDVAANKYTLGFGWGRSAMVALPGCLLLVAAWLEFGVGRWRLPLTAVLLAVYLSVNVVDFEGRDRQMFHTLQAPRPNTAAPELVVVNSRAWGHVLRLAYYLPLTDIEMLAADPANVPEALGAALAAKDYSRVLWLKAEKPLWNAPASEIEAAAFAVETEAVLEESYVAVGDARSLEGTMDLDSFTLQIYQ